MSNPTFRECLSEAMYSLAYSVADIVATTNEDDLVAAVNLEVETRISDMWEPLTELIVFAIEDTLVENMEELDDAEEAPDSEIITELDAANEQLDELYSMFQDIRDYALRFRDSSDKVIQKFACTILTLIAKNTPPTLVLPEPNVQLVKLNTVLLDIRKKVTTGRHNAAKDEIAKLIDSAIPGVTTPPEEIQEEEWDTPKPLELL